MMTKIRYVQLSERPDFVSNAHALGHTLIMNAPRPLYGDMVDDTWNLPVVHGRHYAALTPNGTYTKDRILANTKLDAVELRYVPNNRLESLGRSYYGLYWGGVPARADVDDLINLGLDIVNRHEVIEPEDDNKFGLDNYPQFTGE